MYNLNYIVINCYYYVIVITNIVSHITVGAVCTKDYIKSFLLYKINTHIFD